MKKILIIILFFHFSFSFLSWSVDFRYLRTNEGLYNGEINAIALRFFKPELGNPKSLPDKKTHRILIDSENDLWLASLSGVSMYNRSTDTFYPVALEGHSTNNYYVNNIYESKGSILIHTSAGIYLVDQKNKYSSGLTAKRLYLFENGNRVADYVHYMNVFEDKLFLVSNKDIYNPDRILIGEINLTPADTLINVIGIGV